MLRAVRPLWFLLLLAVSASDNLDIVQLNLSPDADNTADGAAGTACENSMSPSCFGFVHIPKTGGTFLEGVLIREHNSTMVAQYVDHSNKRLPGTPECPGMHTPPQLWEHSPWHGKRQFTVLRHPYERFMSEYKWRCRHDKTLTNHEFWKNHYIFNFNVTAGGKGGKQCSNSTTDMNNFARKVVKRGSQPTYEAGRFDCHLLPQAMFTKTIEPEFVFCNASAVRDFGEKMGIDLHLYVEVPYQKQHNDLDPDVKQLLREVYKEDFELCGFPTE